MIIGRPMFIIFWLITAPPFVGGCLVHPTSVVATVGEKVILNCATHKDGYITSWEIGTNTLEKTAVYKAPVYTRSGSIGTPEKIADGYFVTHPADNETTLYMNKTILSQAGIYVCICNSRDTAATRVVVLDSEPKFITIYSVAYGGPVTFGCSMSFNASSDVSCDLKIASGSTVARINVSTVKNGLVVCNLKHTSIPNAFSDQWYTCNVALMNREDIIYSRVLKTLVVWQSISSTADILSKQYDSTPYILTSEELQREGGIDAYQVLAFPITLTIACVIITMLSAVTIMFYRKYIKLRNACDANKISTEDSPGQYAALDLHISPEAGQRESYATIQLPISRFQPGLGGDYMNTDFSKEYETGT